MPDEPKKIAVTAITGAVFAWLRNNADSEGKVKLLRGELGEAAERITAHLLTEIVDYFAELGLPIEIKADDGVDISITISK